MPPLVVSAVPPRSHARRWNTRGRARSRINVTDLINCDDAVQRSRAHLPRGPERTPRCVQDGPAGEAEDLHPRNRKSSVLASPGNAPGIPLAPLAQPDRILKQVDGIRNWLSVTEIRWRWLQQVDRHRHRFISDALRVRASVWFSPGGSQPKGGSHGIICDRGIGRREAAP